jgi:hypothetical protein
MFIIPYSLKKHKDIETVGHLSALTTLLTPEVESHPLVFIAVILAI